MNPDQISPGTQQFLSQFGQDLRAAVLAAPDAGLMEVSPRYRQERQRADEQTAKQMMIGEAAEQDVGIDQDQPLSQREAALRKMLEAVTVPGLRKIIDDELSKERAIQEHLMIIGAASQAGDEFLAERVADNLATVVGLEDREEDGSDDGSILDAEDQQWLEAADAEARAVEVDQEEQPDAQSAGLAGGGGEGAGADEVSGAPDPSRALQAGESEPGDPGDTAAPGASVEEPEPVGDEVSEQPTALTPTGATKGSGGSMADQLSELFVKVDTAAHEAATSPQNDKPEPTEGQRDAGNYQKGHIRLHGLDISIENPKGSRRRPEWPELTSHYGYIRQTTGNDDDHVDVFIGDKPESQIAFVVDQIRPESGAFDEHKVILGTESEAEARELYLSNYKPGWKGLGAITPMPIRELKRWLQSGETTRPVGKVTKPKKNDE